MRLYPPAVGVQRITTKETILGGYKLPKETVIYLSIIGIHYVKKN